jgi:RES domain-containing protein
VTIRAWRIIKTRHAAAVLSGQGAKTYGGRWNSPGTAVVYTAQSASLAILEMLVHLQAPEILAFYTLFEVAFDSALVSTIKPGDLPRNWRQSPPPRAVQRIGDEWVAGAASPVLRVPSTIVPSEFNYLLHPGHPDFGQIVISPARPIRLDPRLMKAHK